MQGEYSQEYNDSEQLKRCQSATEAQAVAWVIADKSSPIPAWSDQLGTWWPGRCEGFVELAYGVRGRAASALTHYEYRLGRGSVYADINPPAGTFVF